MTQLTVAPDIEPHVETGMARQYTRAEIKERARTEWRGACNVTLPSFTSDFSALNAPAIEHDVRLAAEMGFWGTLVASESGTSTAEYRQFMEIAADAAPPGFRLVHHASFSTIEEMATTARVAEELGFEATLVSYPPAFRPTSARDIVEFHVEFAKQTDLAQILFAVNTWGFKPLHASGFPPDAIEEVARLETTAAVKYEASAPGMIAGLADVLRRCGDRVLVQCPMEQYAPGLVEWFGMPWIGTSAYESFGDRVPTMLRQLHGGDWNGAMKTYWSYQTARDAKAAFHATFAGANLIHRVGWKYLAWLNGFSGGLLRMPQMRLNPNQMRALRQGLAASGFDLPDGDDDGFYRGRFPA